ncbi:MAG: glycosyltransferase family 4 protein [Candidatus Omnitrophica bacterium]|nr:glycosyltransferase family 4 protein [Candidatus Omnitrophota bacterium]
MGKSTILYMIDVFHTMAGAEKNLFETVSMLDHEKFNVIVVCLKRADLAGLLREQGIEVIDLNLERIYSPYALIKALDLIEIIKKNKVKIVVTCHEGSDFYGSIIAKIAKVPAIISNRRDMGYKLKKRHIYIYRIVNKLFTRIIVVSQAVKNIICAREGVKEGKIAVIYNGVDINAFNESFNLEAIKQSFNIGGQEKIIGMIAGVRPIKGYEYFIEAANLILKRTNKAKFLIVGWYDKQDEYYKKLKKLIGEYGIEDKIIFTGGRSDIPEMLALIDIFVLSSINEGFPNAVIEAMAAGKPVVATNSGGTSEAIVDGEMGILVEPRNPNLLAEAVLTLLGDKGMRDDMGRAGKQRAMQLFNKDAMIKNIENLFEELLDKPEGKK